MAPDPLLHLSAVPPDTTLHRAAHTLKPNSGQFGAKRLAALCEALEAKARQGQLEEAAAGLMELEAEFNRVISALAEEKARLQICCIP